MARIDRRRLLRLSGAGAITATTAGGVAAILASGRAPAHAQGTTLHWLRWSDFVPASDQLLRNQIVPQGDKALGIKINLETINANDIQARITAAIQSGSGADIFYVIGNWPQLYIESVSDVSDVAEAIGEAQGGFYDVSRLVANDGKKWIGMPWTTGGGLVTYRKSWFAEIGYSDGKFPDTWDTLRDAGKKLKAKGRPLGQTLGHTFGDAPSFWYPYLWSWGGKEVEADGKTVVLNSKETIESVKFAVGLWKDACDEGGFAWDDSSNNRAYLSGTISATNNGASIYLEAKKKPDSYLTEKGTPLWQDTLHAPLPKGPGGQFVLPFPSTHVLMKYSKNQGSPKTFCAGSTRSRSSNNGSPRSRATAMGRQRIGRKTRCGTSIRSCCRFGTYRIRGGWRGMPAHPAAPRPRRSPNTSSSTCTRRRRRACRLKTPSNGRMANW